MIEHGKWLSQNEQCSSLRRNACSELRRGEDVMLQSLTPHERAALEFSMLLAAARAKMLLE